MEPNVIDEGETKEMSTERQYSACFERLTKSLADHIKKQRGMILSQMSAIGYTGINITAYVAGSYLPASDVPMWTAFGVFIMTSLVVLTQRRRLPSSFVELTCVAITGMFAGSGGICLMVAIIFVNPGDAIAIYFTVPVVCTFYGVICCGERFSISRTVLVLLAVTGVSFLSGSKFIFEHPFLHDKRYPVGLFVALLASINYGTGFTILHYSSVRFNTDPLMFTLFISLFGTSFSAFVSFAFEHPVFPTGSHVWIILITCSCFSFVGGISLSFALTAESASFVSIATTTEMIYTYLAQFAVFGITPTWFSGLGAVMILISCIGLNFTRTDEGETESEKDPSDVEPLIKDDK